MPDNEVEGGGGAVRLLFFSGLQGGLSFKVGAYLKWALIRISTASIKLFNQLGFPHPTSLRHSLLSFHQTHVFFRK